MFYCQLILNLAKFFIVLLYVSSNRFGKIKTSIQLNRLEKVIDKSIVDGGEGSYPFQLFDGFSFDGDGVLDANYGYFERQHEILRNGNLFDYVIISIAI